MTVAVHILDGPLGPWRGWEGTKGHGAVAMFEGIVREHEDGGILDAIEYQAYQPMAERMLERIARELIERRGLLGVLVEHSRGRVRVGERSFRLVVVSPHRKEALAAMDEFIDQLKRDVPIWKKPIWRRAPMTPG